MFLALFVKWALQTNKKMYLKSMQIAVGALKSTICSHIKIIIFYYFGEVIRQK
jgi:hypothetical protein